MTTPSLPSPERPRSEKKTWPRFPATAGGDERRRPRPILCAQKGVKLARDPPIVMEMARWECQGRG